jgi:hypothetical protein
MPRSRKPPWTRSNPRKRAGQSPTHLPAAQKATARRAAKRAGRRYPNLVDNMRVAAKAKPRRKTTRR